MLLKLVAVEQTGFPLPGPQRVFRRPLQTSQSVTQRNQDPPFVDLLVLDCMMPCRRTQMLQAYLPTVRSDKLLAALAALHLILAGPRRNSLGYFPSQANAEQRRRDTG
jgi:hypothetical protein